jgi:hypothetical protein
LAAAVAVLDRAVAAAASAVAVVDRAGDAVAEILHLRQACPAGESAVQSRKQAVQISDR